MNVVVQIMIKYNCVFIVILLMHRHHLVHTHHISHTHTHTHTEDKVENDNFHDRVTSLMEHRSGLIRIQCHRIVCVA